MEAERATTGRVAVCIGAGLAVALLTGAGLSMLAKPADQDARVAIVSARASEAERADKLRSASEGAFAAGSVCPELSDQQLDFIRQSFSSMAGRSGAGLTDIVLLPAEPSDPAHPLAHVQVILAVDGPYPAVLQFLELVAQSKPAVFVDQLDLKSKHLSVSASLTGKVYCSTASK